MEGKDIALYTFTALFVVGFFLSWCCCCPPGSSASRPRRRRRRRRPGEEGEGEWVYQDEGGRLGPGECWEYNDGYDPAQCEYSMGGGYGGDGDCGGDGGGGD